MYSNENLINVLTDNQMEENSKMSGKDNHIDGLYEGLKSGSFKVTVETETVKVPSGGLAPRLRKGIETIKVPRTKKKRSRLTNVPSKSEVFAAKIASAIDENIDSDSDETFVYEINTRSPRQLSRASSISSIVSHSRHIDGKIGLSGKHSMKFTNHSWSSDPDRKDPFMMLSDVARSPGRISAFPSSYISSKVETGLRSPHRVGSRTTSCPSSPHYKYQKFKYYNASCRRHFLDKNTGAFCTAHEEFCPHERIPLLYKDIGCFSDDQYYECHSHKKRKKSIFLKKFGCIFIFFLILFACAILLMAITQPLQEAKIANVTNIVVSPKVLIMDLEMVAFNPNFWQISIQQADISIFSSKPWSELHPGNDISNNSKKILNPALLKLKTVKKSINQTNLFKLNVLNNTSKYQQDKLILLGHVLQLDVPFVFRSAFWSKSMSRSIAQFRLENPNSSILKNDSSIWNDMINSKFQLVIKGFLKYVPLFFLRKQHSIQIDYFIDL